jgi:hypothetical protein
LVSAQVTSRRGPHPLNLTTKISIGVGACTGALLLVAVITVYAVTIRRFKV